MANNKVIKGTCQYMCPPQETSWREKNGLLHVLEIKQGTKHLPIADPDKTVKQFSRSAAGKAEPKPSDLRPSDVLLRTMTYLVDVILPTDSLPFMEVYNFINDRVQAIRQDIIIQMLGDDNIVQIFEKCVRFYVFSSYYLCEEPQANFDQFLNKQQLCICLEKLLDLYQFHKSSSMNEFISLYFSLYVDDCEKIYRHEMLFVDFFSDSLLKATLATCVAWIENNFIKFFSCVKRLPMILKIMFFHQFGFIRKKALKSLSIAFSSTACQFPIEVLSRWLCLTTSEMLFLCGRYKINVKNNYVLFHRKDFLDSKLPNLKKEFLIDELLEGCSMSSIINGRTMLDSSFFIDRTKSR